MLLGAQCFVDGPEDTPTPATAWKARTLPCPRARGKEEKKHKGQQYTKGDGKTNRGRKQRQ